MQECALKCAVVQCSIKQILSLVRLPIPPLSHNRILTVASSDSLQGNNIHVVTHFRQKGMSERVKVRIWIKLSPTLHVSQLSSQRFYAKG